MTARTVVGLQPLLPGSLQKCEWLTTPVPAERLAALRIGTGLVLFFDVLLTYVPFRYDYFGPGSLAEPGVFADNFAAPHWTWSLLHQFPSVFTADITCGLWLAAAAALTLGVFPRVAALVAWALSISVLYYNAYLHNSGDLLRQNLLFLLMLTPCGAAWSITRPRGLGRGERASVSPWALRVLFVLLVTMYFFNGLYKVIFGSGWQEGSVLHYVLHTPGWSRWSPPMYLPPWSTAAVCYFVLAWELLFPALVFVKTTRVPALLIGVAFHVVTFFGMEIGPFGLYALCLYLPLMPWERCRSAGRRTPAPADRRTAMESRACVPA